MSLRFVRLALTPAAVSTLAALVAPSSAWAWRALATIQGAVQGVIDGDNITKDSPKAVVVRAMSLSLNRPFDVGTGQTTGKIVLRPFRWRRSPTGRHRSS